jgi:hypothetical protein
MTPRKKAEEAQASHLDADQRTALLEEAFDAIRGGLMEMTERCEREQICVGCFARIVTTALLQQAAWFGVIGAELSVDPAEVCTQMVSGFEQEVADALLRRVPTATRGTRCAVH